MNYACTIIPIHPPKFNFAIKAIQSFNKYNLGDLYIIFSNESDMSNFQLLLSNGYIGLVLPNNQREYGSYVTVKKLFGVNELIGKYKYIAVFDSEVEFIKSYNQYELYKSIFNKKSFKSNKSKNGKEFTSVCLNYMELGELKNIVIDKTNNLEQYWWFNEICVYESDTFRKFYNWFVNHKNYNLMINDWSCFDYNLYSIWLLVFENFEIKKLYQNSIFHFGAIEYNKSKEVSDVFQSYADSIETDWSVVLIQTDR